MIRQRSEFGRPVLILILGIVACGAWALLGSTTPLPHHIPEGPGFAKAATSREASVPERPRTPSELSPHLARLTTSDGRTDIDEVVSIIDDMANDPESPLSRAEALVELLDETSRLYSGRDGYETRRLRAYALARLSEPDVPDVAIRVIIDVLANAPDALSRASAARAAGKLGERGKVAVPVLTRLARPGAVPTIISLDRFSQVDLPKEEWTTERVECVRALGRLGPLAAESIPVLRSILDEAAYEPLSRKLLVDAARIAIDHVEAGRQLREGSGRPPASVTLAGEWSQPSSRPLLIHRSLQLVNQSGSEIHGDSLTGKPLVVAFFYVSCGNPERCARTIDTFRHLRSHLEERRLATQVRLALVSLEPVNDTPATLLKHGISAGLPFDEDMTMLRPTDASMETMDRNFKLPVSRCCNLVTTHGVPFFLLDRHGRLARRYEAVGDELGSVLEDVSKLVRE